MKLCVMGLGYIGLPTAVMFARHGVTVHGVDINSEVIDKLAKQQMVFSEPGLKEMTTEVLNGGTLSVSVRPVQSDVFIIAVPTPINPDKTANLQYVIRAAEMIVPHLETGNLVILESTVPPKTVQDILIPVLNQSGLKIGDQLFVSYSPERVYPGKLMEELVKNDRIIGGFNEQSAQKTVELYKRFVKGHIYTTDVTTAEMVKLIENAYRDINIAFSNELARIAEKIGFHVWEAIKLANSHPRVHVHSPGPGVGGHCIAVDPWFIIEKASSESILLKTARIVNDRTPFHIVEMIEEILKDIRQPLVTLLGLTYKENVDDMRESPSLVVMNELKHKGYRVKAYDPYIAPSTTDNAGTIAEAVTGSDCLVLLTSHDQFRNLDFTPIKELFRTKIVLDTRNVLNKEAIIQSGFEYYSIGTFFTRKVKTDSNDS